MLVCVCLRVPAVVTDIQVKAVAEVGVHEGFLTVITHQVVGLNDRSWTQTHIYSHRTATVVGREVFYTNTTGKTVLEYLTLNLLLILYV